MIRPSRIPMPAALAFLFVLSFSSVSRAEDTLSEPSLPEAAAEKADGPTGASQPAEKAPAAEKPSAQPQFSLPEVVITGDNQLTIGAQRLDRRDDDVTLGSRELRGLSRIGDELPGLDKARTGTAALTPEGPRDTAAVLHLGGGLKETVEGWGLIGHRVKKFKALLRGFGDTFGGEETPVGKTWSSALGWGLMFQVDPTEKLGLRLSRDYVRSRSDLPWYAFREDRKAVDLDTTVRWKFAPTLSALLTGRFRETRVITADADVLGREREGSARVEWESAGKGLGGVWFEGGVKFNGGVLYIPSVDEYTATFGRVGAKLDYKGRVSVDASCGVTRFDVGSSPNRAEPSVDISVNLSETSHMKLHWNRRTSLPSYQEVYAEAIHTSARGGLLAPGFIKDDVGGEVSQRLGDRFTVTAGAKTWKEENHLQWNEAFAGDHLQALEVLGPLKAWEGRLGLEAEPSPGWFFRAEGFLSKATNESGDGRLVTGWPEHRGVASLTRKWKGAEIRLKVQGQAEREAGSTVATTLAPWAAVGLEASKNLGKKVQVWVAGDNLTGARYEMRPGYPEPRFKARAGLEVVL